MPLFANRFLLQTLPQSPWRGAVVVLEDGDKVGGVVIATEARQLRCGDVCLKQDVVGELHTVLYKPQENIRKQRLIVPKSKVFGRKADVCTSLYT